MSAQIRYYDVACVECGRVERVRDLGWTLRGGKRGIYLCDDCEGAQ